MLTALRDAGVGIGTAPSSKKDLALIQARMNEWQSETGLPYRQLSRILAMSTGDNRSAESLRAYMGE